MFFKRVLKTIYIPIFFSILVTYITCSTPHSDSLLPMSPSERNDYFRALKLANKDKYPKAKEILCSLSHEDSSPFIRTQSKTLLKHLAAQNNDWKYFLTNETIPSHSSDALNIGITLLKERGMEDTLTQAEITYLNSIIYDLPAHPLHEDLYQHISEAKAYQNISWQTKSYAEGKSLLAQKAWKNVLEYLEPSFSLNLLQEHPRIFEDIRSLATGSGEEASWTQSFLKMAKGDNDYLYYVFFSTARLLQSQKDYKTARQYYKKTQKLASNPKEFDRALWYELKMDENNNSIFLTRFKATSNKIHNPRYFDDILEAKITSVLQEKDWEVLVQLFQENTRYLSNEIQAQLAWTLWFLNAQNLITIDNSSDLLAIAYEKDPGSYWSFLAGYFLDQSPLTYWLNSRDSSQVSDTSVHDFINGFIRSKQLEQASEWALSYQGYIDLNDLMKLATALMKDEQNLNAIRIMGKGVYQTKNPVTMEALRLLYPNPYSKIITKKSDEHGFNTSLLFALIRTESAFTPDIHSSAGAVGLMQLMPATAREQAKKLGIKNADLTSPKVNLTIATEYIQWLYDREYIENDSEMLLAYNGGIGNLRKWQKAFYSGDDFLFSESVPYYETRNYVRKIFTRSMLYYEIYYGGNYRKQIEHFYPSMHNIQKDYQLAQIKNENHLN